MDTVEHVWTIPATRMKMKRDHRVPLCGRALAILAAGRTLGYGPLVFPSRSGRRLAVPQLRLLLARCVVACSAAGAEPHATLDDTGTAETLLIQWQWWRRSESIRPEVHIYSYFRKIETPDPRETLKSRGPGTKQVQ